MKAILLLAAFPILAFQVAFTGMALWDGYYLLAAVFFSPVPYVSGFVLDELF